MGSYLDCAFVHGTNLQTKKLFSDVFWAKTVEQVLNLFRVDELYLKSTTVLMTYERGFCFLLVKVKETLF